MKSKNPKFIKRGIYVLVAILIAVIAVSCTISNYQSSKLAITKADVKDALLSVKLTDYNKKEGEQTNKDIITKYDLELRNEQKIRSVVLEKRNPDTGNYFTYSNNNGTYSYLLGDLNNDEKVDQYDAAIIWQYKAGERKFSNIEKLAADVNGDGEVDDEDIYAVLYGLSIDSIDNNTRLSQIYLIGNPSKENEQLTEVNIDNGKIVKSADARMILRASEGISEKNENETILNRLLSDYDMDGKITSMDAKIYLKASVGAGNAFDEQYRDYFTNSGLDIDTILGSTDGTNQQTLTELINSNLSQQLRKATSYANVKYNNVKTKYDSALLPIMTEEGEYRLKIGRIEDGKEEPGNLEEETYTIIIDRTAPVCTKVEYKTLDNQNITTSTQLTGNNVKAILTFDEPVVPGTENDGYTDTKADDFSDGEITINDKKYYQKEVIFTQNETKTLAYYDKAGNYTVVPVTVNNIDKVAPTVTSITYNPAVATNQNVTATINFTEAVRKENETQSNITQNVIFEENGIKYVTFSDNFGNITVVPLVVTNIDKTVPVYQNTEYNLTDRKLKVNVSFNEDLLKDKQENASEDATEELVKNNTLKLTVKCGEHVNEVTDNTIANGTVYFDFDIPVDNSGKISAVISGKVKDLVGNESSEILTSINDIGVLEQTGIVVGDKSYSIKIDNEEIDYTKPNRVKKDSKLSIIDLSDNSQVATLICGETNNEKVTKIGEITLPENIEIYLDGVLPEIEEITAYPESALKDKRYVAGTKLIFKITASEELDIENIMSNIPQIQLSFTASGIGKYNYTEDKEGFAKFDHIENNNGKGEIYYTYIIQEGDEGNLIYVITEGNLVDLAGNEAILSETQEEIIGRLPEMVEEDTTISYSNIELGKGLTVSYKFFRGNVEIDPNKVNTFKIGDTIKVNATFNKHLYYQVGGTVVKAGAIKPIVDAPILSMTTANNKDLVFSSSTLVVEDGENVPMNVTYTKTLTEYDIERIGTNPVQIKDVILNKGSIGTYFVAYTAEDGTPCSINDIKDQTDTEDQTDIHYFINHQVEISNLKKDISSKKMYIGTINYEDNIYADTTAPRLTITANKVSPTNAETIKYTFRFSEVVKEFDPNKIIVNNGTKGDFEKIDDLTYTLDVTPNTTEGNSNTLQVIVEAGACNDLVNRPSVRAESKIIIDRIRPELKNVSAGLNEAKDEIIVTAEYNEAILSENDLDLVILIGGKEPEGTLSKEKLNDTTIKFSYKKSALDNGKVDLTLSGYVMDVAGNKSEEIERVIENNIELELVSIKLSDGSILSITELTDDPSKEKYYTENQQIVIVKKYININNEIITSNRYEYTVTGEYDNEQMKYLTLIAPELEGGIGSIVFSTESGDTDITALNIFFDTTNPELTTEIKAVTPVTNGFYKNGSEFRIKTTSSEKLAEGNAPEISVTFDDKEGAFNEGKAELIETIENEDNTVSYIYKYIASNGDDGALKIKISGTISDLAGHSVELNEEKSAENITVDSTRPTVTITTKEETLNKITNADEITYVFTWSEPVTGFTAEDVILSTTLENVYTEENVKSFTKIDDKTYELKVKTLVEKGPAKVEISANSCVDVAGQGNIANNLELTINKIQPKLVGSSVELSEDETTLTVVAEFDKAIEIADELVANIKIGNRTVNADDIEKTIDGNKVIFTFNKVSQADNGKVEITLTGKVTDFYGNESEIINTSVENNITLKQKALEIINNDKIETYTFEKNNEAINDFDEVTYLKENDVLEITKEVLNTSTNETTTTVYEGTVTEDENNGKIINVKLEEGTKKVIFGSNGLDISSANIIIDTIAPTAKTKMSAKNRVTSGRYTTGDEFEIAVNTSEETTADEIPEIEVEFGNIAGKFNNGKAEFVGKELNEDKTTTYKYRYLAAIGDEGIPRLKYVSGIITDLAGNSINLADKYNPRDTEISETENYIGVNNVEFLNENKEEVSENGLVSNILYVRVYLNEILYTAINTEMNPETAPELYLNGKIKYNVVTTVDSVNKYIEYRFNISEMKNIEYISNIKLINKVNLYKDSLISAGTMITDGTVFNLNNKVTLMPVELLDGIIIDNIYVDTTAPMVTITTDKSNPTNADEITYTFEWNEKVNGFDLNDITVNNGQIVENSFETIEEGRKYTLRVKPSTTQGNTGTLKVIVEADGCIDEVGLKNIRRENAITIDKIAPVYESYTVTKEENQIKVTTTFNEEIGSAEDSEMYVNIDGEVTTVTENSVSGKTVTYIYNIAPTDSGKPEISIYGNVKDKAGNSSRDLNIEIENYIELTSSTLDIDGIKYSFKKNDIQINDLGTPIYFKAEDKLTVTKTENEVSKEYEYQVENKYADNTKITKVTLIEAGNEEEVGTLKINEGTLDITNANIYFDTVAPTVEENIIALENEKTVYTAGETVTISVKPSEELKNTNTKPEMAVKFDGKFGIYNKGEAKLIDDYNNELIYQYKVVEGDNGELTTGFISGTIEDLAGNITVLTNLNVPEIKEGSTILNAELKDGVTVEYELYKNGLKLDNFDTINEFKPNDKIKVVAVINKKVYSSWGSTENVLTPEYAPVLKLNNNIDMVCESVNAEDYKTTITYTYEVTDSTTSTSEQIKSINLIIARDGYYTDENNLVTDITRENVTNVEIRAGKVINTDIRGLKLAFNKYNSVLPNRGVFADTIAPEVEIKAKANNTEISSLYTNSNEITYELIWSEEVVGFTADDITINNGIKGQLSAPVHNPDGTYTYTLTVTGITEGQTQIILEANKCSDKGNLNNARQEMKINVDQTAPIFVGLDAYAESENGLKLNSELDTVREYYKVGDTVTITATFNENIIAENIPELALQFSESGNAKGTVEPGIISTNTIKYTYEITAEDEGELLVKGFNGNVKDIAGNSCRVTKKTLDGNTIIADTTAPRVKNIKALSPENGTYKAEKEIKVEVEFTEEVYNILENKISEEEVEYTISNLITENIPTLKIKIGNEEKETVKVGYGLKDGRTDKTKLIYTYTIVDGDNGKISLNTNTTEFATQIAEKLCDIAGNIASNNETNTVSTEIIADTKRPEVTSVTARVDEPTVNGTENYFKAGNRAIITVNYNEPVSSAVIMPQILVGFSETELEPAEYNTLAYESDWNSNSTKVEYTYLIKDGDNGYLYVKVPENQFKDIAGNENEEYKIEIIDETTKVVVGEKTNVYADTTKPTITLLSNTDLIQNNQTITVTATFNENVYDLVNNTRKQLTSITAPKLVYSFGTGKNKEIAATRINGKDIIYTIHKDPVDDDGILHYELAKGNLCDRAGNEYYVETTDTTAPQLQSVNITNNGSYGKYCKQGTEIYVTALFNEEIASGNMKLRIKVGEGNEEVLTGIINSDTKKQVEFKYTVKANDNGKFKLVDVEGMIDDTIVDEEADKTYGYVKDSKGNQRNIFKFNVISGEAIVDTEIPSVTSIKAIINGKAQEVYNEPAFIRTNANIIKYEITFSEDINISESNNMILTNGTIKDIKKVENTNNKVEVTVQTTIEGVQSLIINEGTVEDLAGNKNAYTRLNAVTTDFTMPTVRFISEYNGGNYVLPTNIANIELRPNVEISEDISKIEYKWNEEEYVQINDYSSSSDIAIPSKVVNEAGTYRLFIRATDLAGNVNEAVKDYKVLNSSIQLSTNKQNYTNEDLVLTVIFEEGLTDNRKVSFKINRTGETVILNATGTTQDGKGITYSIPENGTVYAEATDKVGNKVYNTLPITNIDKQEPEVNLSIDGANLVIGTDKTYATIKTEVEAKDLGVSGIDNVKYTFSKENLDINALTNEFVDNMTITTLSHFEAKTENAEEGTYYLYIVATDKAGNSTNFKSREFKVANSNVIDAILDGEGTEITPKKEPLPENTISLKKDAKIIFVEFGMNLENERNITFANPDDGMAFVEECYAELFKPTTITAVAEDVCGNKVIAELTVEHIDGPDFEVIGNPEDWTNRNAVLEVICYEELSSLTVNGTEILETYAITVTENGEYKFIATDKYGNSTEKNITVDKIDKEAPTIKDNIKVEGQKIRIEAEDNLSGVKEYAITETTEAPVEWSGSPTINTTKDGIFYVWAKDYAGNIIIYVDSIIVDSTAPTIQDVRVNGRRVVITAVDNISGIAGYALTTNNNTPANDAWANSREINLTEDGIFYVWVKDRNNNIALADDKIIVDITKPSITNVSVNKQKISITATDEASGIDGYAITDTTEVPVEWDSSNTIETIKDGIFYAWTKDKAGNVTMYATPIVVDTTAPEVTFTFSSLKEIVGKQIGAVIGTNEDAIISYSWDNENWTDTTEYVTDAKATLTTRAEGDYTLYAKAKDRYSNESKVQKLEFKVVKKEEEVKIAEIEFEDLTTVQVDGIKYVKVSPTLSPENVTSYMNVGKLEGATPIYNNLTANGKLKTGSEIKIDGATQYVVIVKGDVNNDGNVDFINDIILANNYRLGKVKNLNTAARLAADINDDNDVDFITDIIGINNFRLGKISTL